MRSIRFLSQVLFLGSPKSLVEWDLSFLLSLLSPFPRDILLQMVLSRCAFESSASLPDSSVLKNFPNPHFFQGLAPLFLFPSSLPPAVRPHVSPGLPELMTPWLVPAQMVIVFFKPQERQSCSCLSLFFCLLDHTLQFLELAFYSLARSWEPFTGYLSLLLQPETPSRHTLIPGSTRCLPWAPSVQFHNRGKCLCVPSAKFILWMILHLTTTLFF